MSAMLPDLAYAPRPRPPPRDRHRGRPPARNQLAALYEYAVRQANALAVAGAAPRRARGRHRWHLARLRRGNARDDLRGAIFVPLNVRLTAAELGEQLRNAAPAVVLCDRPREGSRPKPPPSPAVPPHAASPSRP